MGVVPVVNDAGKEQAEHLPVIDLDDFEEDRRDEEWLHFLEEAKKYRASMQLDRRVR